MNSLKFSVKVIMLTNVWGMRKCLLHTKKGLGFVQILTTVESKQHRQMGACRDRRTQAEIGEGGVLWTPTGLGTYGAKSPRGRRGFHLFSNETLGSALSP